MNNNNSNKNQTKSIKDECIIHDQEIKIGIEYQQHIWRRTGIDEVDLVSLTIHGVISVAAALLGILLGYVLSEKSRKNQNKGDLKKVKELLADGLQRIDVNLNTVISNNLSIIRKIESKDDEIISKLIKNRMNCEHVMSKGYVPLQLDYWKTIESSGHMMKLSPDQIKKIGEFYSDMIFLDDELEEQLNDFNIKYERNFTPDNNSISKTKKIPDLCIRHAKQCIAIQLTLKEALNQLGISWIKITTLPESEYSAASDIMLEYMEFKRNYDA